MVKFIPRILPSLSSIRYAGQVVAQYLFVEIQRDVDCVFLLIPLCLRPRRFEVVENSLLFHAVQEMLWVIGIEWLTRLKAPQFADYWLGFDVEVYDVQLSHDELRTRRHLDNHVHGFF